MRQGMTVDGKIAYAWRSRERGDFSDYHSFAGVRGM